MTAMANLMLVILCAGWLAGSFPAWVLISGFFIKVLGEFVLLKQVLGFLNRKKLLLLFLPAAILIPLYFILSGRYLLFPSEFDWKGRSHRS
jgi:hypothetical protein